MGTEHWTKTLLVEKDVADQDIDVRVYVLSQLKGEVRISRPLGGTDVSTVDVVDVLGEDAAELYLSQTKAIRDACYEQAGWNKES